MITESTSLFSDATKDATNLFIAGTEFMDFSGLKTLKILIDLVSLAGKIPVSSATPRQTTVKSSQFQESLMYEFLCNINPIAVIFKAHSMVNTIVKNLPRVSIF